MDQSVHPSSLSMRWRVDVCKEIPEDLWKACDRASAFFKSKYIVSSGGVADKFESLKVPDIDVRDYILRLIFYLGMSESQFLLAIEYIDRYMLARRVGLTEKTMHRLAGIAMVLAHKFDSDFPFSDSHYARVTGMHREELMMLQMEFLLIIGYRLMYPQVLRRI